MDSDTILLCSDGLTRELTDAQIAEILGEAEDSQEVADELVERAKRAGGGDNITAIVLRAAPRPVGALGRIPVLRKLLKGR
jgi:protein phosphatase